MRLAVCLLSLFFVVPTASAADAPSEDAPSSAVLPADVPWVFVEAESFDGHGGWKLDTQFIENMGSPYLLAHGIGRPVKDATTTVEFPEAGKYRVFVRTMDWVARWDAPGQPGRFQLLINGKPLAETFGTKGAEWHWHDGGTVTVGNEPKAESGEPITVDLALRDLTGFDGRCDAIYFTKGDEPPPNAGKILPAWRQRALGLPEEPVEKTDYDLVVIGGGYSGMGAAISAARMGCQVALIQNRPVLGGNGSSEVRVWAMGNIRRGKYPRIGEIVDEFCDHATKSPGTYEEFEDAKKERIVRAEPNIDLFLNHHAYKLDVERLQSGEPERSGERRAKSGEPESGSATPHSALRTPHSSDPQRLSRYSHRIKAVYAFDTRTGERKKFAAPLFVDATGHGTIGALAGADWDMTPEGRMGMSNMWAWAEAEKPVAYPETPWALDLTMRDFPYPRDHHGQWFWEGGFDKHPIKEAEAIRDWNLRAVFGAFNAMKNKDGADRHQTAYLTWVAYIGGPRESRRLMGDVLLTQEDVVQKREFKDGCVPSTWSIDLHYPKKQYADKFPTNPFISIAVHDHRVDRNYGYPVPYRCFYSRNIENLFMAGRCISVTHEALGTVRVMKTCGMMGEVVGKAAWVCTTRGCTPREVYQQYWDVMDELLRLPGKARREGLGGKIEIPDDALPLAGPLGPPTGLDPAKLSGIVVDDRSAKKSGHWTEGTGLKGYVGYGYLYAGANSNSAAQFSVRAPKAGRYEIRIAYQPHENRGNAVPVTVKTKAGTTTQRINMQQEPPIDGGFISLGTFKLETDETAEVVIATKDAGGNAHADAVQVLPAK